MTTNGSVLNAFRALSTQSAEVLLKEEVACQVIAQSVGFC